MKYEAGSCESCRAVLLRVLCFRGILGGTFPPDARPQVSSLCSCETLVSALCLGVNSCDTHTQEAAETLV